MAYNKTKLLESAQKYLNQGKISQAIGEYQQILKQEPKDQVTLMTIGDLYVRQGETFQALEYFERLAQIFLSDGFVTKAIATYKKIAKLAPEESKPLERLAELYVQQGVMSEARPLYLQLAEVHLKANRHQQAVVLLRRLLEAEPDNLRVQMRLADLYQAMGQESEAVEAYLNAAKRVLARRDHGEAERLADRALKIDPANATAQTLKAQALIAAGKRKEAIQLVENLPGLDAAMESSALLVDQYLEAGDRNRAAALASKVFERDSKNYELAYKVITAQLEKNEIDGAIDLLGRIREAMIETGDQERAAQILSATIDKARGQIEPLEWLVDLYSKTSNSFHLPDALSQLGEAALAAGRLEQAKSAFEQLVDRAPDNEAALRRLDQVRAKMGLEAASPTKRPVPSAPPSSIPELTRVEAEPVPPAPVREAALDEETEQYINQALTDVDLFSSYGLTQKAMDLLETVRQRAPRNTQCLEKLLDLYLGSGNDRQTAELAAQLQQIYTERADRTNAERFAELRRRFERAAAASTKGAVAARPKPAEPTATGEEAVPIVDSQPVEESPAEVEAAVHEVDLSEEWAALSHAAEPPGATPTSPTTAAPSPPPTRTDESPGLVLEAPPPSSPEPREQPVAEFALAPEPTAKISEARASATEPVRAPEAPASSPDQFLSDLYAEIEAVLPTEVHLPEHGEAPPTPISQGAQPAVPLEVPPEPPRARGAEPGTPLEEVFEEFRAELDEMEEDKGEDLETHYNLGIAYREMGLLEEAIGEFQRVAKACDQGRPFRYFMQCCTMLGLAFMEKGQPWIAAIWYERALQTAGLDQESILALRYDLGVAQELAGDEVAALKSFRQVYAMNIDYRDVAERLAALGKPR